MFGVEVRGSYSIGEKVLSRDRATGCSALIASIIIIIIIIIMILIIIMIIIIIIIIISSSSSSRIVISSIIIRVARQEPQVHLATVRSPDAVAISIVINSISIS